MLQIYILYLPISFFKKCISAVTLLSISFSIASPGEQQSYSFYSNAGNNHIFRGKKNCNGKSLTLVEKLNGFSYSLARKLENLTCKLPKATKHQNLRKVVSNFCVARALQSFKRSLQRPRGGIDAHVKVKVGSMHM